MKKILHKYPEAVLAALAIVFVAIIIAAASWGINNVVGSVNQAVNAKGGGGQVTGFDLKGAGQLNLRGLVKQSQ